MSKHTPLRLKVVEINNSHVSSDVLIADDDANVPAIILGREAVYGQVADRLTGDIIVKAVNCFPEMLEALKEARGWIELAEDMCRDTSTALSKIDALIAKAEGIQ